MKKIKALLFLFLAVAILFGAYFLVRPYWRFPFDKLSPFEVIPTNTGLVIGFDVLAKNKDSLFQDQLWALDVKKVGHLLDSFGLSDSNLWEGWWMIPKQLERGGEIAYTFIGNGNSNFTSSWKKASLGIPVNYGDGEVYAIGLGTADPLYFSRIHNLLIAGKFPFQVEEALSLLKTKNDAWQNNPVFEELNNLSKEKGSYRTIIQGEFLAADMPEQWMSFSQKNTFLQHIEWLWLELDKKDSIGTFSAYIAPQKEVSFQVTPTTNWQWIPEICQTAIPLHFNELSIDWTIYIAPWLGAEGWELALDKALKENVTVGEIWLLPIADTSLYTENYAAMIAEVGLLDKIDYQRFQLIQLKNSPVFSPLSDRKGLQMWMCELDGALLCAVSREDMERWLDYYMVGGSIDKEPSFLLHQQALELSKQSQLLWRWNPLEDQETNLFSLFFPREEWANSGQLLAKIEPKKSGLLSLKGSIQTYTPRIIGPTIAWTLPLQMEEEVQLIPAKNIYTEQVIALAVQDKSGHFIFLDSDANVLWEKENVAPILGDLYVVPWHNGILHLLAATKTGVKLWDENGMEIDQLPQMTAVPSAGISIAHFGQKDQLAVFVPTNDGQIWGFTPAGELLEGWPIKAYEHDTIVSAIRHFQFPTQDLIISWSDSVGWKAFDKLGKPVFDVKNLAASPIALPFGQQLSDDGLPANNRLVMAYNNGIAQVVSFAGESFNLRLGRGPADHFIFSPIWGDARSDYVVQRGRLVHLFGYEKAIFSERWQHYFTAAPDTIIDMAPYGLISINNDKKELWLLDGEGQLLTDIPLAGQQNAFLLNTQTQGFLLVTLLDGELYAYRLIDRQ